MLSSFFSPFSSFFFCCSCIAFTKASRSVTSKANFNKKVHPNALQLGFIKHHFFPFLGNYFQVFSILPRCQYANAHSPARPSDLPPCVAAVATSSPRSNCDIRGPSWPDCRAALKEDRAWKYKQSVHHIKFLDGIWIMKHGIRRRILFLNIICNI